MLQDWSYLLGEIWGLIAAAGVLGLGSGWLIFGGQKRGAEPVSATPQAPDPEALKAASEAGHAKGRAQAQEKIADLSARLDRRRADGARRDAKLKALEAEVEALRSELAFNPRLPAKDAESNPAETHTSRPSAAPTPPDGGGDDLTRIKGIGPKLAALCHELGIHTFDQIASWSEAEIAWMDDNLEGFKGRVSRDDWVDQAQALRKLQP